MITKQTFPLVHTTTLTRNVWVTEENNGTYRSYQLPRGRHIPTDWVKRGLIPAEYTTTH